MIVQDLVIEPVDGPYVRITADGAEIGHMASEARIELKAGELPVLTLKIPFMRCRYNGKCAVLFEENENDYPTFEAISKSNKFLRERNENLKKMVDDLNRRLAIMMDT